MTGPRGERALERFGSMLKLMDERLVGNVWLAGAEVHGRRYHDCFHVDDNEGLLRL